MQLFQKKIFWFFLIGLLLGGISWKFFIEPKNILNANAKKEITHVVKRETIKQTMTISGNIEANDITTVRFKTSGFLSKVNVKKGEYVKKGQILASLDPIELKKNLQKDLNTYEEVRRDFDQSKDEHYDTPFWNLDQHHRDAITRAYEKAQFDLNNSVLDVELENIALQYATLASPMSGIVTSIGAPFAGVHVTSTQAEFEITSPDSLYFSLLPDQTEVTKLQASMTAELMFDSYPDEKVTGTVEDIAFTPKTGETNTVYEVKVLFNTSDPSHTKYRVAMTGDAIFTTQEKQDILAIPLTFITNEKDKKYVMKKTGSKKEKLYVETGIESDDMVEIIGGLAEGDVIYD